MLSIKQKIKVTSKKETIDKGTIQYYLWLYW